MADFPIAGIGALLSSQTLLSDSASVTFSSISAQYNHLLLICYGRHTQAVNDGYIYVQFNGDTGNNYDFEQLDGAGSSTGAALSRATNMIRIGDFPGSTTGNASTFGQTDVLISNYATTTFFKSTRACGGNLDTTNSGSLAGIWTGQWRNTAAINSIVVLPPASNFLTGSIFMLYAF